MFVVFNFVLSILLLGDVILVRLSNEIENWDGNILEMLKKLWKIK
jgi:hypothetical protein